MICKRVLQHAISLLALTCLLALAVGSTDGGGEKSGTSSSSSSSKKWYQGGNLHNATYAQWKGATYQNKLATAADWLAAIKWKGHLNSKDDFDKLKVKAHMLVEAVDGSINVDDAGSLDSMNITEVAAIIITVSNDLGP